MAELGESNPPDEGAEPAQPRPKREEPHLPDISPVPPRQHHEPVADPRAVAFLFLVFLLILALMYELTQGRT